MILQVLKAGLAYFALVFGVGFVLGAIRTTWVAPRIGARRAELMEMPIMVAVTVVTAKWTILHLAIPDISSARLGMGCFGLILMIAAEFGFVLWLRGMSIKSYFASRDPVSGTAYYLALVIFATAPLFVATR